MLPLPPNTRPRGHADRCPREKVENRLADVGHMHCTGRKQFAELPRDIKCISEGEKKEKKMVLW